MIEPNSLSQLVDRYADINRSSHWGEKRYFTIRGACLGTTGDRVDRYRLSYFFNEIIKFLNTQPKDEKLQNAVTQIRLNTKKFQSTRFDKRVNSVCFLICERWHAFLKLIGLKSTNHLEDYRLQQTQAFNNFYQHLDAL